MPDSDRFDKLPSLEGPTDPRKTRSPSAKGKEAYLEPVLNSTPIAIKQKVKTYSAGSFDKVIRSELKTDTRSSVTREMLKGIYFDDHKLLKAKFPDAMLNKLKNSENNIKLANVPNPSSPNEDEDESQLAHHPPDSPPTVIDGGSEDGIIDDILAHLSKHSVYNDRENKWNSWPQTNKKDQEVPLAAYLNEVVDTIRVFLDHEYIPDEDEDGWVFSARYCNKAVQCEGPERKPDLVIVPRNLSDKENLEVPWSGIRGIGELKSTFDDSRESLIGDLAEYARLIFGDDEARRFVLCFTIRQAKMSLISFDRSGSHTSHEFNVHKDPHSFIRVIVGLLLSDDYYLGLDPSFTREGTSRFVTLNNKRYKIIKTLQLERVIRGRGTVALLVEREDGVLFVIKDQWVDRARTSKEPDISKHLSDQNVEGIATIVEYQIIHFDVEGKVVKDSTETDRSLDSVAEKRDHYRLLITPYGDKLENFSSLKELVSAFKDYVKVIIDLHKAGVVHRDISKRNLILVGNKGGAPRKGYIIDFDYAIFAKRLAAAVAKAERTGTYPFMAIAVLLSNTRTPHSYYHDLESLFYVLIWICFTQKGPNGLLYSEAEYNFKDTPIWDWYNLTDDNSVVEPSLKQIGNAKRGQMGFESAFKDQIISQLPDYFVPLSKPLISLRRILFREYPYDVVDIETVPDKERCINDRDPELVLLDINKVLDTALEDLSEVEESVEAIGDVGKTYDAVENSSIPPLSTCCLEAVPYRTRSQVKKEKEAAALSFTSGGSGLARVAMGNAIRSSGSKRQNYDQDETTPSGSSTSKRSKRG